MYVKYVKYCTDWHPSNQDWGPEACKIEEKKSKEERTAEENDKGKTREAKELGSVLQHRHGANESNENNALGWEQCPDSTVRIRSYCAFPPCEIFLFPKFLSRRKPSFPPSIDETDDSTLSAISITVWENCFNFCILSNLMQIHNWSQPRFSAWLTKQNGTTLCKNCQKSLTYARRIWSSSRFVFSWLISLWWT